MPDFAWSKKRVVVTGGGGFLGRHMVNTLHELGCTAAFAPRQAEYDVRAMPNMRRLYADPRPNLVIHAAGIVGGIGVNQARPGEFFYDNLMMRVQLLHAAWQTQVEKFVAIGTVCAYPKLTPVP